MRAIIIGNMENFEVIAEEFTMEGIDHRFIVHESLDKHRERWAATHLETSQIIGWGDTIDAAIMHATLRWMSQPSELIESRLVERRIWVEQVKKERGMA